jgi:hypothetical protein
MPTAIRAPIGCRAPNRYPKLPSLMVSISAAAHATKAQAQCRDRAPASANRSVKVADRGAVDDGNRHPVSLSGGAGERGPCRPARLSRAGRGGALATRHRGEQRACRGPERLRRSGRALRTGARIARGRSSPVPPRARCTGESPVGAAISRSTRTTAGDGGTGAGRRVRSRAVRRPSWCPGRRSTPPATTVNILDMSRQALDPGSGSTGSGPGARPMPRPAARSARDPHATRAAARPAIAVAPTSARPGVKPSDATRSSLSGPARPPACAGGPRARGAALSSPHRAIVIAPVPLISRTAIEEGRRP